MNTAANSRRSTWIRTSAVRFGSKQSRIIHSIEDQQLIVHVVKVDLRRHVYGQ